MRTILSRKSIFRFIRNGRRKNLILNKKNLTWMKHYLSSRKYDGYIEYIINSNLLAFVRRGRGASFLSGGWLRLLQQSSSREAELASCCILHPASFCCGLVWLLFFI